MKKVHKSLYCLGITSHYLRLFFKYFGILYVLFFCIIIYMSCSVNPNHLTTPYIYSTKGLNLEQFSEILDHNKKLCGITSIGEPYRLDNQYRHITELDSYTRILFQMEVSEHRVGYVVVDCIDSLEIYPYNVNYIGENNPYDGFPELNEDLRMLLYHNSVMKSTEDKLHTIIPNLKKTWLFPFQSDLWLLLFAVRPNKLCFFLHFMLIGNFIIMYIFKLIEMVIYRQRKRLVFS